jgi:DNA polymerase (family X)
MTVSSTQRSRKRGPRKTAATNAEIAAMLDTLADLLEIEDANPFRVRAYRNAARTIREHAKSIADLLEQNVDLSELPGIGEDLAEKIAVIVETGSLPLLEEVKSRTPAALSDLMHHVEGLGPKRVKLLYKELAIRSAEQLQAAAAKGALRTLPGFGEKLEQRVLERLEQLTGPPARTLLADAERIARPLLAHLEQGGGTRRVTVAGSFRRCRETVGDLDVVVSAPNAPRIMDRFTTYQAVREVVSKGDTRSTVKLRGGMQVDLRVVPEESYGAALLYFTGSKAHNIALRKRALKRGYKMNEYGVFRHDKQIPASSEEEIYRLVDLPYIEPELREDRGEIAAAENGALPRLVTLDDLRGDLRVAAGAASGKRALGAMLRAAAERGYEYLAVSALDGRAGAERPADVRALRERLTVVDELNASATGVIALKLIEAGILKDGTLDAPDELLAAADLTACFLREPFDLPRKKQTDRILRAMDHPRFNVLARPTGRVVSRREPYPLEMERIMLGARERGCFIELDGRPDRLDPSDEICKLARDAGVAMALSTEAERPDDLDHMRFAVNQARRGWLEAPDVLNTRSLNELRALLKRG